MDDEEPKEVDQGEASALVSSKGIEDGGGERGIHESEQVGET